MRSALILLALVAVPLFAQPVPAQSTFETWLIPILEDTDGQAGTRWTSTAFFYNDGFHVPIPLRDPLPGGPLVLDTPDGGAVIVGGATAHRPRGFLWYPSHDLASHAHVAVSVQELTGDVAAEVPVAHESDFRSVIEIFNVPRGPRYRASLRVYSLDGDQNVSVGTYGLVGGGIFATTSLRLTRYADDEPAFGMISDLLNLPVYSLHFPPDDRVRVEIRGSDNARLWAIVSVVDQATSQFRILTPQ